MRVYNRFGKRDNKYKARIKILVKALTAEAFAAKVEDEWQHLKDGPTTLRDVDIAHYASFFAAPAYQELPSNPSEFQQQLAEDRAFARWVQRNTHAHQHAGYRSVVLSLKKTGVPPGDITAEQMEAAAAWADRFGFGELRVSHEQNLILPDVREQDLYELWQLAKQHGFATPNIGLLTDIICCPGGDFCSLANARSIPVAEAIQRKFDDLDYLFDLGDIDCNFSGCMNACGHHHIGNIGILGWIRTVRSGTRSLWAAVRVVRRPSAR
ncbi:nitrite/sulfite reductase [Paludibacterium denitrificans]|uniref:nitrite/sulfite reductase n=1 Tax=Paludibacterium denitrificans TaxID=2675226 RepID=UPI0028A5D314|nr:nitrite/sulfite reductase [Paludibacterium denitrificans]